jgi:Tol biopolymer transport system component
VQRLVTIGILAALVTSCGGEPLTGPPIDPTAFGILKVQLTTEGLDPDPDGYAIGETPYDIATLPPNGSATLKLANGARIVTLTGQSANCVPEGSIERSVTISYADTATLDLHVVCFRDPILFDRQNFGTQDENIWVVDASGGPAVDLTGVVGHSAWFDGNGSALSPDRSRLVFSSDRHNTASRAYIMALNKSFVIPVAVAGLQGQPSWSPDGSQVAYYSYESSGTTDIFVINADGSNPHAVVRSTAWEYAPVWSPDGSKIAFERDDSDGQHPYGFLVVANADGSGETRITDGAPSPGYAFAVDAHARWSPDGSRIVFERQEINSTFTAASTDLWMVRPNGSDLERLTDTPGVYDQFATWRDDGAGLVWSGCTAGCRLTVGVILGNPSGDIWRMNADGTGIANVTNTGIDAQPVWNATRTFAGPAAAASFLVVTRYEGGTFHLYRLNPDGSEPLALTTGTLNDVNPQWR